MITRPDFTRDKDFFPGDTGILDSLPDLVLVLVAQRAVQMGITILQSVRDGLTDLSGLGLPGAQADSGDRGASVEFERAR